MALTTGTHPRPHRLSEGTATAQIINSMPRPLQLDTSEPAARAPHHTPPKLRLIKPAARDGNGACGFGTCALDPACTSNCRYREANRALSSHYSSRHTQRAAMPPIKPVDRAISTYFESQTRSHTARRRTAIFFIAWCVGWMAAVIAWASFV